MNEDQKELTLDESLAEVMQTLPPVIRTYLSQGKYTVVAKNLMAKYSLRIDQGGVLEREIMLLLMGIETPDEFTKALVEEARLDQPTIDGIVKDINEQIFIPLRKEEEGKGMSGTIPVPAPVPVKVVVPQPPLPSHIAPLPPKFISPSNNVPPVIMPSVLPVVAPAPDVSPASSVPPVAHRVPLASLSLAPSAPPLNLPGAMPPLDMLEVKPPLPAAPLPVSAPQPIQPQPGVIVPNKNYSADPYREPVDEV